MLSPDHLEAAGDAVAAVYTDMEAKMLDHLTGALIGGAPLTERTTTELLLLSQTHDAQLREIVDEYRPLIDEAVLQTAEEFLRASDEDDMARAGGTPKFPQAVEATVAGMATVLARDNLDMVQGAKTAFLEASIEAVTKTNSGLFTAEQAIHGAVRKLERDGISIISYRNAKTGIQTVQNKVDVAVRRHVRTQIAQDSGRLTMERMEELDVQLVEVTSHEGSRPSHQAWEGRCYSLKGDITIGGVRYKDFYSSTGYGHVDGLLGANCRHSFGPYRHGTPRAYHPNPQSPTGLSNDEIYELTQKQRYLEREIRADKRELRGMQQLYKANPTPGNLSAAMAAKRKLSDRQAAMRQLINEANAKAKPGTHVLTRNARREWAGDMPKKSASMSSMKHNEPLVKIPKNGNALTVSPKVNTKAYHDAFEALPLPKGVTQSAYEQAGRILQKTSGTQYEHLVAINARTGALLTDNLDMPAKNRRTGFTKKQYDRVASCSEGAILVHNHPQSRPPSFQDVMTAASEPKVKGSIVVGHDGSMWYFSANGVKIADELSRLYNSYKDVIGDRAESRAVKDLIDRGIIEWRRA